MQSYDDLIESLKRESEMSSCSDAQKAANVHMINMYQCLKNKRPASETPTYNNSTLEMDIMLKRLNDKTYRFSIRSLQDE
ncbi:hypothetical protein PALA111701_28050 [Paenibacillus lactis]